jgi:hypothetical protein
MEQVLDHRVAAGQIDRPSGSGQAERLLLAEVVAIAVVST